MILSSDPAITRGGKAPNQDRGVLASTRVPPELPCLRTSRVVPFLKKLPKEHKFAVEIRNKEWLVPKLADVLREHGVALTLIDQGWMPRPWEMKDKFDLITSNFTYVRWLGDRKGIEEKTTAWDKVIVDRQGDLSEWVSLLKKIQERRILILAFANNHYAGFGPGTLTSSADSGAWKHRAWFILHSERDSNLRFLNSVSANRRRHCVGHGNLAGSNLCIASTNSLVGGWSSSAGFMPLRYLSKNAKV